MSSDALDQINALLSAATTATPEMRLVYVAEARMRLVGARDRLGRCEASLNAIETEIARVARTESR